MCKKEQCPNFDKCKCNKVDVIPMTTSPHHIRNQSSMNEFNIDTIEFGVGEWDDTEKVYNFVPDSEVLEELGTISYISPLGVFDDNEEEKIL